MDVIAKLDNLIATKELTHTAFRRVVLDFFKRSKRSFPWRETHDPYEILVSEIMLQQTQTERVVQKYQQFLEKFPSCEDLAQASVGEVISEWQGLGYYRRALNLHRAAQMVVRDFGAQFPTDVETLRTLPGLGPYTAAAVATFAFGSAVPMIETNIRALYLYCFFPERSSISDREVLEVVEATLDKRDPRRWFYALMDVGVELKRHRKKINHRSKHYARQSRFEGSHRQVRAAVLRLLTENPKVSRQALEKLIKYDSKRVDKALAELEREGFVTGQKGTFALRGK
jgi:A/G-specific adenine glycosylase